MATILIEPTCCGKSTLARKIKNQLPDADLIFGFELLNRDFKKGDIVHYNLLKYHLNKLDTHQESDLLTDPIFLKIWNSSNSNKIDKVIVIVAPKDELIARASNRLTIEENLSYQYPSQM